MCDAEIPSPLATSASGLVNVPTTYNIMSHDHKRPSSMGSRHTNTTTPSVTLHYKLDMPILTRTLRLLSDFTHHNARSVNASIKLLPQADLMLMVRGWLSHEVAEQRRLVRFAFSKLSLARFVIDFEPIRSSQYDPNLPIILCIYWREKDCHIVTLVDIVLLLEFLIQQSFSIEEKNRIRRNLQSLKPETITRANEENERFFSLMMNMENPRPRNIEKDLKVFKWQDLLLALDKVVSKYLPNLQHPDNQKYIGAGDRDSQETALLTHIHSLAHLRAQAWAQRQEDMAQRINTSAHNAATVNAVEAAPKIQHAGAFMPHEHLKLMRRRINVTNNVSSHISKGKNKIFQHALTPADPVPLTDTRENEGRRVRIKEKARKKFRGLRRDERHQVPQKNVAAAAGPLFAPIAMDIVTDSGSSMGEEADMATSTELLTLGSGDAADAHGELQRSSDPSIYSASIFSNSNQALEITRPSSAGTSVSGVKPKTPCAVKPEIKTMDEQQQFFQYPKLSLLQHRPRADGAVTAESAMPATQLSTHNILLHNGEQKDWPRPVLPSVPKQLPPITTMPFAKSSSGAPQHGIKLPSLHPVYNAPGLYNLPLPVNTNTHHILYPPFSSSDLRTATHDYPPAPNSFTL